MKKITILIKEDLYEALLDYLNRRNIGRSEFIREAIKKKMEKD